MMINTNLMKKTFLTFAVIFVCMAAAAQNSADLKLNPEKNKVYRLQSVSEQTIVQTVNGNQQVVESKTSYTVSLKMVDATTSFIVAEVRFDTLSTSTNTMGKTSNMSSASEGNIQSKETSDIVSYFMNKLSRSPLYAKIDFTGKVIEIVNSKMLSDMILRDTAQITLTGAAAPALKTQIAGMINDNTVRSMIEMFTSYLPGKTVSTGDNWSVTSSTNAGGMSLEVTTSYHLDGISGNNASLTSESGIKAAANALPMESGVAKITYEDLKGLSKNNLVLDTRTGLLIESNSKSQIAGNLGVTVPGMSMEIPMEITSNTRIVSIQ
jgi:hypothetical protein